MSSRVRWGASMHRFGKKFDHGLLTIIWKWRLRQHKITLRPDYDNVDWNLFNTTLTEKLLQCNRQVGTSKLHRIYEQAPCTTFQMRNRHDQRDGPAEEEAKLQRKNNLGENTSTVRPANTRLPRDFSSERTITKSDRQAWGRVLAEAGKQDYKDWVTRWIVDRNNRASQPRRRRERNIQRNKSTFGQHQELLRHTTNHKQRWQHHPIGRRSRQPMVRLPSGKIFCDRPREM